MTSQRKESTVEEIREAASTIAERDAFLSRAMEILHRAHPAFSWTGIYLTEGDALVLSTFQGPPTPHHRIRIGIEGICGDVASRGESEVIPDVSRDPRYLMCSIEVKSELVVPIRRGGEILGVIDIDSNELDAFSEEDRREVESIADLVADRL